MDTQGIRTNTVRGVGGISMIITKLVCICQIEVGVYNSQGWAQLPRNVVCESFYFIAVQMFGIVGPDV